MNNEAINIQKSESMQLKNPQTIIIQSPSTENENKQESKNMEDYIQSKEIKYNETPYRFIIVITYFFLNFANGEQWVTYASVADKFRRNYNQSRWEVDLYSMLFMIVYPLFCVPEAYLIDNINMRLGLSLAALTIILGSLLKIFTNNNRAYAYIGQILSGSFQPAILNSPAKIASIWFKDSNRALVTSICCVANTIGVLFGYIFHTFFIDDKSEGKKYKDEFKKYVFWEFILTAILCLPTFFLMRNKPKIPVSNSQKDYVSPPLKDSLKLLFKNKNFVLFLVCATCIVGFFNIYGTILNQYLALYKVKDDEASYTSAAANGFGIITCLIVSCILDSTKKFKQMMFILNICGLVVMIILTILLEIIEKNVFTMCIVVFSLIIGFVTPIYTTGMDYVAEMTYPVGESISGGLIMCFNQIFGIIGILIADAFIDNVPNEKYLTNVMSIIIFTISLICIYFIEERLLRNEKENENKKINSE